MGKKGDRGSGAADAAAAELVEKLQPLGHVTSRKMFGGHGIFEGARMFALIDTHGDVYLKAGAANSARFEAAGSTRHGRMPYYIVPDDVLDNDLELLSWAQASLEVARA